MFVSAVLLRRCFSRLHFLLIIIAIIEAGCGSLPSDGPSSGDIRDEYQATSKPLPFELVDLTATVIETLKNRPNASLAISFGDYRPAPDITIGRGDGVTVNIWETGSDTLFSSTSAPAMAGPAMVGGRGTLIPEQTVGSDGGISVPFAGRVSVAGHTTLEVQQAIEQALAGKAQKPQVLVNISRPQSSTVTVVGDGAASARVPISIGGERLLDVLAAAGGPRAPTYESWVQLTRNEASVTLPLARILNDPKENIYLRPADDLVVLRQPQTFTAFGATGRSTQINFDASHLSLIEAVAKSGGLLDSRANPRGVYLFRYEPQTVAEHLSTASQAQTDSGPVAVIYRLDLTKAGSYFLAQNFDLRDHDVLFVSSASFNQLQKFLNLLGLLSQPIVQGIILDNAVK